MKLTELRQVLDTAGIQYSVASRTVTIGETTFNFQANGDYIYPGARRSAVNNLKRTLLRELLKTRPESDAVIQFVYEQIP